MGVSRRDVFKLGGLAAAGAAGLALPWGAGVSASSASLLPSSKMPRPFQRAFTPLAILPPREVIEDGKMIHEYVISAKPGLAGIVPGMQTPILGYGGKVPAPRIDAQKGIPVRMTMRNDLPAAHPTFGTPLKISTHLHGAASLPQYDGYADDVTGPGQMKTYHYENNQNARTMWYHDHGVHYTAQNAYSGLASQYHLHDDEERGLLPQGKFDVGLTLTDMMFAANGSLMYDDRSHSGLWGDVILVNGTPWPVMKVQKRIYRFRILNASISRSYRPTTYPAAPTYMVATDGGLMPKPQRVTSWRHGGAERYEVLIDFSNFKTGQRIELRNLSNDNNRDYDYTGKIMAFDVTDEAVDTSGPAAKVMPVTLRTSDPVMDLRDTGSHKVRNIRVQRSDSTNEWNLNGESWRDVVESGYKKVLADPGLGDTEVWEFQNNSGGWFHPMHVHLVDFRILSRNGRAPFNYELGPKDVAYVGEGETVRVIMKFGPHKGKYMVHCHNLPHEDHDMMHQFSVGMKGVDYDPYDPIASAPPVASPSPAP